MSLAGLKRRAFLHWHLGRPDSRLLVVRDATGEVLATWRPPADAEILHLSEALSPDGRYLVWLSGMRPDSNLYAPLDPPLTLHIQDLLRGEERARHVLLHPNILQDLRRQVMTVDGWGEASPNDRPNDWIPTWIQPTTEGDLRRWLRRASLFTMVVEGVFNDGIGRYSWSPDGRHLAVVAALEGPTSDLYLLQAPEFQLRRVSSEPEHVTLIAWSPTGRLLVYAAGLEPMSTSYPEYRSMYAFDLWTGVVRENPAGRSWRGHPNGPMTTMFRMTAADRSNAEDGFPVGWIDGEEVVWGLPSVPPRAWNPVSGSVRDLTSSGDEHERRGEFVGTAGAWLLLDEARFADNGISKFGVRLFNLRDGSIQPIASRSLHVEAWDLPNLPWIMGWPIDDRASELPSTSPEYSPPTAFGPEGQRMIMRQLRGRVRGISPDHRWRIVCGDEPPRCQIYADGPEPVGGWAGMSAEIPTGNLEISKGHLIFSPDSDSAVFLSNGGLWSVSLPDGSPRWITAWDGQWWSTHAQSAPEWYPSTNLVDALTWFGPVK